MSGSVGGFCVQTVARDRNCQILNLKCQGPFLDCINKAIGVDKSAENLRQSIVTYLQPSPFYSLYRSALLR
jgi:hypothetical protein